MSTSPFGCFLCNDDAHRADNCWTCTRPTSKDHHEARIATYRLWLTDQQRVNPRQKQKLIERENRMWADVQKERKAS